MRLAAIGRVSAMEVLETKQ